MNVDRSGNAANHDDDHDIDNHDLIDEKRKHDATNRLAGVNALNKLFHRLPPTARGHVVAILGEFVGTFSFLFFAFAGTQSANVASTNNTGGNIDTKPVQKTPQQLLYISLAFGFSLAVNAWVFFRISGGLFNPAVCLQSA
jgi:aquaporin related protein